jgi:hypothetical protein
MNKLHSESRKDHIEGYINEFILHSLHPSLHPLHLSLHPLHLSLHPLHLSRRPLRDSILVSLHPLYPSSRSPDFGVHSCSKIYTVAEATFVR